MSIFARSSFPAAGYAAFRPSYPPRLFQTVLGYHKAPTSTGTLLDLGCGHGLISREMSPHFARVIAADPSAGMVKQAQELTKDPKITFRHSGAEDLSFLADNSVDMVVAGQAAHWFDYKRVWPELARVVKSGGSLAFWGYKDNILVGYPQINPIIDQGFYTDDELAPGMKGMASYWEQPGRNILRDSMQAVVPPETEWKDVQRIVYEPDRVRSEPGDVESGWLQKRLRLGEFEGYLRTFSSYRGWKDDHPHIKSREEGGEGDIIDVMFDKMVEAVPEWKAKGPGWKDIEVESYWGTAIILARRV